MNERRRSTIGKVSAELLMGRASQEVNDPENNLAIARRHLETGSGIVIFNHFKGDFFVWARFVQKNLASLDNVTAMVAMKYLDPQRGIASKALSYMFPEWEKSHGVKVLPVVQTKDYHLYSDHRRINMASTLKARSFLQTQGHVLAFSPEGTRSQGELGEAEEGIDIILRANKDSIVIPVAAQDLSNSSATLLKSNTRISVGAPFFYQDIEADHKQYPEIEKKDLIMQRIANLLPEQNRGFYRYIYMSMTQA